MITKNIFHIKSINKRIIQKVALSAPSNISFLDKWKTMFFYKLVSFSTTIGFVVLIPSLLMCLYDGLYFLAFIDFAAWATCVFLLYNKNVSINVKKIIFLVNLYILGAVLISYLGIQGPGYIYLLSFSIIAALLISPKAGYLTLILNQLTFISYVVFHDIMNVTLSNFFDIFEPKYLTVGLNVLLINFLLIMAIDSLLKSLIKSHNKDQQRKKTLKQNNAVFLMAKEIAERNDKFKSAFLANLSHEIRTPLNGIIGFSQLLKSSSKSPEKQEKFIEIIKDSGYKTLNIVNDIISISKIETGQISIHYSIVEIDKTIKNLIRFFQIDANKKGIVLIVDPKPDDCSDTLYTDNTKFNQILINLIKNAILYTEKGNVTIGYSIDELYLKFYIKDTGVGISEANKKKIFNRFERVAGDTESIQKGAGLGLGIAKSFVELMGGQIWFDSIETVGTTFYFTLPIKDISEN